MKLIGWRLDFSGAGLLAKCHL